LFIPLVPVAYHFMVGNLDALGTSAMLAGQCQPTNGLYSTAYTDIHAIDFTLCLLTTFFHVTFDASLSPLIIEFGTSLSVLVVLPFLEMSRAGRAFVFRFPLTVIFWTMCQLYGAGNCFPIFWLAMVISGHATVKSSGRFTIDQAHAEATFFALCAGFLILSAVMFALEDPVVTAMWQPFPIWMGVAWIVHLCLRPSSLHKASGHRMVYSIYLFTFAISAAAHTYTVWPLLGGDPADLANHFFPHVPPPTTDMATLTIAAKVFLQWDMLFSFGASFLGTLWFATSLMEFIALLGWSGLATAVFGPGATLSGTLIWREWRLNGKQW
jgi:hypothetical protein